MADKRTGTSVRMKLLLSYMGIGIFVVVIGVLGILNIREVYENGAEIYANHLRAIEYLNTINQNVKETDYYVVCMMTELGDVEQETDLDNIESLKEENAELMELYEKLPVTALEERRYNQCRLSILSFNKKIDSIIQYIQQGATEQARSAYEQEVAPAKACTYELLEAVVQLSEQSARSKNEENADIYSNLLWVTAFVVLLGSVTAVLITICMSRYLMSKLSAIQSYAKRISEYNVTTDIASMGDDEFGQTIEALNDSQFMIRDLLEKIIQESAAIGETGEDVSLAVRKANGRIEEVNVQIYNTNQLANQMEDKLKELLSDKELKKSRSKKLDALLKKSRKVQSYLYDVQAELTNITMYIEQIAITADYQNEMSKEHRQLIQKFKV